MTEYTVQSIRHYTPEAEEARTHALQAIERERNMFLERVKPYMDILTAIENNTPVTHILVPK